MHRINLTGGLWEASLKVADRSLWTRKGRLEIAAVVQEAARIWPEFAAEQSESRLIAEAESAPAPEPCVQELTLWLSRIFQWPQGSETVEAARVLVGTTARPAELSAGNQPLPFDKHPEGWLSDSFRPAASGSQLLKIAIPMPALGADSGFKVELLVG